MKILIVSQYFWPESFRINDLAVELKNRGHEVTVLTGKPNYPQGKIYDGYKFWGYTTETYQGVNVIRVPLIPRGKSSFSLVFNYLSFIFFGSLYVLFKHAKHDVVFAFGLSPITLTYPAILYKILHKVKLVLWVQDLWPESVTAASNIHSRMCLTLLERMVRGIYRKTDKILIQSEAFKESIQSKGVSLDKISYIPNWAEDLFGNDQFVSPSKYKGIIPKGFIVMFAGNVGEAQDFDSILKAANETKDIPAIKWVIVGDGRKANDVKEKVHQMNLSETFIMLGRYPLEEMPSFFIHSDIMLLSLKDKYIFSLTVPSKVQSYMAFGKPIITMINGIGNKVVQEAQCGYIANAGDYLKLAENVKKAYWADKKVLEEKGMNGKAYYEKHFSKNKIIDRLLFELQSLSK